MKSEVNSDDSSTGATVLLDMLAKTIRIHVVEKLTPQRPQQAP